MLFNLINLTIKYVQHFEVLVKIIFIAFFSFFITSIASASLETITIPNAKCGNGGPYSVFIDQRDDEKLMVEFMGGGACWDYESCFILPHTWIFPVPNLKSLSLFTNNDYEKNFLKDHSKIYFPYCTGDIHAGKHVGYYGNHSRVFHNGKNNVDLALNYLISKKLISFNKVNDLVVWGASAGALASMIHSKSLEKLIKPRAHKTMIADSPGLHWGKNFWDKFPKDSLEDYDDAFNKINVQIDFSDGLVVKDLKPFFKNYKNWNIGFLLATRDFVMTTIFGDINPDEQEDLILSKRGLPKMSEKYPNVKNWVATTNMHTFLLLSKSAEMKSIDGESAIDFAKRIYELRP